MMFCMKKKILCLVLCLILSMSSQSSFAAVQTNPAQPFLTEANKIFFEENRNNKTVMNVANFFMFAGMFSYLGSQAYDFSVRYGLLKSEWEKKAEAQLISNLIEVKQKDTTIRKELIFNRSTDKQLNALVQQMIEGSKNKQNLPNVLLHGPSGTGKTASVKAFVHEGFDVWVLPGQSISKPLEFKFLKKWIAEKKEKAKKPFIILVDEAEVLFRSLNAGRHSELVNTFLTELGTPSNKVSWWFTANSTMDLWLSADQAIERRFGYMKLVDRPNLESRLAIFNRNYAKMAKTLKKQKGYDLPNLLETFKDNLLINTFKEDTKGYSADFMRMLGTHFANMISPEDDKEKIIKTFKELLKKEIEDQKNMQAAAEEDVNNLTTKLARKAAIEDLMKKAYHNNQEDEEEDEEEDDNKNKRSRKNKIK